MFGLGGAISVFAGQSNHRLIFACTPVDDGCSNMFYSIWEPRMPGDESDVPPEAVRKRIEKQFLGTVWDDLEIWRYQKYVEQPRAVRVDAKPYMALRKWAQQFYETLARPRRPHLVKPDARRAGGARAHRRRHAGGARAR